MEAKRERSQLACPPPLPEGPLGSRAMPASVGSREMWRRKLCARSVGCEQVDLCRAGRGWDWFGGEEEGEVNLQLACLLPWSEWENPMIVGRVHD